MQARKRPFTAIVGMIFLMIPLAAFAGHDHDDGDDAWHDNGKHNGWYKHHHDRDDENDQGRWANGRRVCDSDGDDCRTVAPEPLYHPTWEPQYVCDQDRDDCRWTGSAGRNYWRDNGGYDYGAPYSWYEAPPPSTYNLVQRRAWLISRRRHAMVTIARMRERGDSRGAGRLANAVQQLDREINAIDRRVGRDY